MKTIYEKYKGKVVTYSDNISGIVCGYTNDNLLLALEDKPSYSFRKFNKEEHFIAEEFKSSDYRYCYCNETYAENDIRRNK